VTVGVRCCHGGDDECVIRRRRRQVNERRAASDCRTDGRTGSCVMREHCIVLVTDTEGGLVRPGGRAPTAPVLTNSLRPARRLIH